MRQDDAAKRERVPKSGHILRAVLWHRKDATGAEYCTLSHHDGGWLLQGTVAQAIDGVPGSVTYRVEADSEWRTRRVEVQLRFGGEDRMLELITDGEGIWLANGRRVSGLEGCLDVDLSVTPATNTLPVRRLGLQKGETGHLRAAWVRFPSLDMEILDQSYTRLAEARYRYESQSGDDVFAAEIEVDNLGLVVTYEDGWERVASKL